jgi:hypothetical protein
MLYEKVGKRYAPVGVQLIQTTEQRVAIIYAFRFALGRRTFASLTMQEIITQAWSRLDDGTKTLIKREIIEAEKDGMLGDECDKKGWLKLLELPE